MLWPGFPGRETLANTQCVEASTTTRNPEDALKMYTLLSLALTAIATAPFTRMSAASRLETGIGFPRKIVEVMTEVIVLVVAVVIVVLLVMVSVLPPNVKETMTAAETTRATTAKASAICGL